MPTQTPALALDKVSARFNALLAQHGTQRDQPLLSATWRAFVAFLEEAVQCDDESLFFETGLSPSNPERFYVHFTRTFYTNEVGGHIWAIVLNCDFLFVADEQLKQLAEDVSDAIEAEDLIQNHAERAVFLSEVEAQKAIWVAVGGREAVEAQIYIGES